MLTSGLPLQVLLPAPFADSLPDDLPGQSNSGEETFSYFSARSPPPPAAAAAGSPVSMQSSAEGGWTGGNAAVSGLALGSGLRTTSSLTAALAQQTSHHARPADLAMSGSYAGLASAAAPRQQVGSKGVLNEVVCGALMLAYERAGLWEQAVNVLDRARFLGIKPNTVMYNTALSALGKAGRVEAAAALFRDMPLPDSISHETMVAAYGMAGRAAEAERALEAMLQSGFRPRDFAYCALIQSYRCPSGPITDASQLCLSLAERLYKGCKHIPI